MAQTFTFPQDGDKDDGAHFASMIGASNLSDYVEQGMTFTVDYGVPEVTVSTGKAFISLDSDTSASTGDTILSPNHVVQTDQQTVALTDNAVNEIYVDPQFSSDDSATIVSSTTSLTGNELLIGTIDTSSNSSSTTNREPDAQFSSVDVVSGDITDGTNTIYDFSNNWIPQARLENDSLTVTAGDGLKNGGSVSLGSSTTLNIEPANFAGTFLSDDGSDNLTVDIGLGLENDGSGNIRVDEDTDFTFTSAIDFSAGLDTQGDITDGTQVIWDASAQEIPDSAMGTIANSTLANDSITVTAGTDLTNGGTVSLGGSITIDHADTSTQGNVSAASGAAITDINLDGRGHTTSISTTDFDGRYVLESGDTMGGNLSLGGNILTEVGGTTDASAGVIRLANAQSIGWRNSANTDDRLLKVDLNDEFVFSDGSGNDLLAIGGPRLQLKGGSIDGVGGTSTPASGAIRLANDSPITFEDTGGNDVVALNLTGSNSIIIGGSTAPSGVLLGADTALAGNNLIQVGGTTDAGNGNIRLANPARIHARNSANNGDVELSYLDGNDNYWMGAGSNNLILECGANDIQLRATGNIDASGNDIVNIGGTTSASTGAIRMANASPIAWRNSGNSGDFTIDYTSNNELVITGSDGVELIRQPESGPTEFIQGADIGSIEAPEDSLTQLVNASNTSATGSGTTIGYTFAVDNQTGFQISAESDGSGGLSSAPDLIDGAGNTVYDQSNNWVPQARVEQGSGSGLDADTVDGTEAADLGGGSPHGFATTNQWFDFSQIESTDFAVTTTSGSTTINTTLGGVEISANNGDGRVKFQLPNEGASTNGGATYDLTFDKDRTLVYGFGVEAIGADFYVTSGSVDQGNRGFGFKIQGNGASQLSDVQVQGVVHDGSSETTTTLFTADQTSPQDVDNWRAEFTSGSQVEFYTDDTLQGSISTGLPTGKENVDDYFTFYINATDSNNFDATISEYRVVQKE